MKKLLSIVLSLLLCVSVTVTNPPTNIGVEDTNATQNEQTEEVSPCEDSKEPSPGEDTH